MKRDRFFSRQMFVYRLGFVLQVCLFAGVLILVNYIVYHNNKRFDLTPDKVHSLSSQTVQVIDNISEDMNITVFYKQETKEEFRDLIELLSRQSRFFHFQSINLDKNPAMADTLNIRSYGAGIIEYKDKKERFQYFTEDNLRSAIIRLTEKKRKIVRFVKGHGEKELNSTDSQNGYNKVRRALESENYGVEDILLMQVEEIPENTLILIISGPQKDFFEKELEILDDYLKKGGRVIFQCDPFPLPNVEQYFKKKNVQLVHDFIIDTRSKLLSLDHLTPIILPDEKHPISSRMNDAVVFPYCRSVIPIADNKTDSIDISPFLVSGPESWAERNTQSVYDGKVSFDADRDLKGPVSVGLIVGIQSTGTAGSLIVMGDSDFAADHYFDVLGNKDLFLNTVNWLAGKEKLISTRGKATQTPISILFLTENESRLVLWSSVIVEPGIVLLFGLMVVIWRRIKRG